MDEKQKSQTIVVVAIVISVILIAKISYLIFFLYLMAPPWQGMQRTEADFLRNKEQIIVVRDYLINSNHPSISVSHTNEIGTMFVGLEHGHVKISNQETLEATAALFNNGYRVISKRGNAVVFLRWSGRNVGRGVVYSINGQTPNESALHFLTRIEPLSIEGWYYYEEDFNEWRLRNQND